MRRSISSYVTVLAMTVFLAPGISAQNLLINPDFDTDLVGWEGPAVWDPADVFGLPSSGSATWVNTTTGGSIVVGQCVELVPWIEGIDVAAYVYSPSVQPGSGHTTLNIVFYSDASCTHYLTGFGSPAFFGLDNWTELNINGWSPSGAASAKISVGNQKDAPGDFQTYCDAIYFGRNPEMLFGDGFETMDTTDWSAVIGGTV